MMRFLGPEDLRRALPMIECIEAMRSAFGDDREVPPRVLVGRSLFMPARVGLYSGLKVVGTAPGHPVGIVVVFGPDGSPMGGVDGPTLTAIRTAGGAGLATDLLAPKEASAMAMLGAGAMAADQVEAIRTVRPVERLLIWSQTSGRAEEAAERLGGEARSDPDEAVSWADIVTTATPSRAPLFSASSVRDGTHLNAIGAFTPEMCEIPAGVVRSAFVVVDDRNAAAAEAGDLIQAGRVADATVGDLLAGRVRSWDQSVTLFKSVGIGSQDVAAAVRALQLAEGMGLGTVV